LAGQPAQKEWGLVFVPLNDEFRHNAYRCLRWSKEARTIDDQATWLSMAQFWFQLAQYVEDQDHQRSASAWMSSTTGLDSSQADSLD
jgi:hypothetical protein